MENYKIIKKEADYLIINKPAGLLTHPTNKESDSLITRVLKKYPEIKNVGDDSFRPGIVHRLDKHVSGLLIIARTQDFFQHLKKQFQNREIQKYYTALAYGQISKPEGEINFPIKRSEKGFKMAAVPEQYTEKEIKNKNAREAKTLFWVEKWYINYTLAKVKIETGRTHQIRVHFFALAHPLVGDNLYQTKKTKAKNQKLNLNRILLTANEIEFKDLEGNTRNFSIDLPEDMESFIKNLK